MNRSAFIASLRRRCPSLTEDEAEQVAKDADEYAVSEHKRRLTAAYVRLLDVPVMDDPKRSDEKEPA